VKSKLHALDGRFDTILRDAWGGKLATFDLYHATAGGEAALARKNRSDAIRVG